jgi:hypothetical protein
VVVCGDGGGVEEMGRWVSEFHFPTPTTVLSPVHDDDRRASNAAENNRPDEALPAVGDYRTALGNPHKPSLLRSAVNKDRVHSSILDHQYCRCAALMRHIHHSTMCGAFDPASNNGHLLEPMREGLREPDGGGDIVVQRNCEDTAHCVVAFRSRPGRICEVMDDRITDSSAVDAGEAGSQLGTVHSESYNESYPKD